MKLYPSIYSTPGINQSDALKLYAVQKSECVKSSLLRPLRVQHTLSETCKGLVRPLLMLGLLLPLAACKGSEAKANLTLPLTQAPFEHRVLSQGQVVPVVQETLSSPERTWGTLDLLVPEGQLVKKGTVIARISTRAAMERMNQYSERMDAEQVEFQKKQAEAPLEILKEDKEVQLKKQAAAIAQLELQKTREGPTTDQVVKARVQQETAALRQSAYPLAEKQALYQKGYLPEQDLKQSEQDYLSLQTQNEQGKLNLRQQSAAYRQPEIKAAELQGQTAQLEARISDYQAQAQQSLRRTQMQNQASRVDSFQRRMGRFRSRLEETEVKAPFDGVVMHPLIWGSRPPYIGMEVWGGLPLVQVAKTDQLRVEARVNEFDIPYVKEGQKVTLSSPSFPGKVFTGKVSKVQKLAKYKDENKPVGLKYFDIDIELEQKSAELKANMSLDVAIHIKDLPKAWTVPLDALIENDKNQTEQNPNQAQIQLLHQGRVQKISVQVLGRNQDLAAIAGNLQAEDRILLGGGQE